MAEISYVGIAFKIDAAVGSQWINENKNNITQAMAICGIPFIKIISNMVFPFNGNETFKTFTGSFSESDLKQSFLLLIGTFNEADAPSTLRDQVMCFNIQFQKALKTPIEIYDANTAIVYYKYTGVEPSRNLVLDINQPVTSGEKSETPRQSTDCSDYIKSLNKLRIKFEALNNEKIILQREMDDCTKSKKTLEKNNDDLREEMNQFKSKNPQQIRQNIANLQRELDRILKEQEDYMKRQWSKPPPAEEQQRQEQSTPPPAQPAQPDNCRSFGKTPNPTCRSKADYKRQSVIFHPDKNTGCPLEAEAKFKLLGQICSEVNEATGGSKTYKKNKKNINKKKSRRSYKKTSNKRHPSKKRHVSK